MGSVGSGLQIVNLPQVNNIHPWLTMTIALREK